MPNQTISGLPSGGSPQSGDLLPIARGGANYSLTVAAIQALASAEILATNYGAVADVQVSYAAACSNGANTVTVTDANFTSADVGKICFATNASPSGAVSFASSVVVIPQGTITAVLSSTQVTVSQNATQALISGSGIFLWGTDDSTALQNAWNATTAICGTLVLPVGKMFIQKAIFINVPANCTVGSGSGKSITIRGAGQVATLLVPTPNFDFTTATGPDGSGTAAFGWGSSSNKAAGGMRLHDLGICGFGQSAAGAGKTLVYLPSDGFLINCMLRGWGTAASGCIGVAATFSFNCNIFFTELDHFGSTNLSSSAGALVIVACFIGGGTTTSMSVTGGNVQSVNCFFGSNSNESSYVVKVSGGLWVSTNDKIGASTTGGIQVTGGTAKLQNCFFYEGNAVGTAALAVAGGTVTVLNSSISNNGGAGKSVLISSGTFVNLGGNTFTGAFSSSGGNFTAHSGEAGQITLSGGTGTITFVGTYIQTPIVVISDETTAGGAKVTAVGTTTATINGGTSDVVDFIVTPNPI